MAQAIFYRDAESADVQDMFNLIRDGFDEFVAIDYHKSGVNEFYKEINPESLLVRLKAGFYTYIAVCGDEIVGIIQLKGDHHISLFFVAKGYQRKGIGKVLLKNAFQKSMDIDPAYKVITVNSSPIAVNVYEKLGFRKVKFEQNINGIRFIPMEFYL